MLCKINVRKLAFLDWKLTCKYYKPEAGQKLTQMFQYNFMKHLYIFVRQTIQVYNSSRYIILWFFLMQKNVWLGKNTGGLIVKTGLAKMTKGGLIMDV